MAQAEAAARPWPALALRRRLLGWWLARLAASEWWTLTHRNVYILPTRSGLLFAATLLVLLLASINYQLSLGHAMTFLLAGAGAASMHLTHGNLLGLTLRLRPAPAGFAGDAARLEVLIDNLGATRHALAVGFQEGSAASAVQAWCDVPARSQQAVNLQQPLARRGWNAVQVLQVHTVFPLGLFRSWTVWRPSLQVLAYPRPESPAPPLPPAHAHEAGPRVPRSTGGGELDGVRPWRRGDSLRQVAWKKVAHTGEMISRDTSGHEARELWLDWEAAGGAGQDVEQRLSRLAAWALAAHRQGLRFGLALPGLRIEPGLGDAHLQAVLQALALHR